MALFSLFSQLVIKNQGSLVDIFNFFFSVIQTVRWTQGINIKDLVKCYAGWFT